MANLSWAAPCEVLRAAEDIVTARSLYADRESWALTRRFHALWCEPMILTMQALPTGSRVLDVGPGYGTLSVAATLLGHQLTAVELFLDPPDWSELEWLRGDICDPRLLSGRSFDLALMAEVLEHLTTDPAEALGNVARALKPGAAFLGSTPNPGAWPGPEPCTGSLPPWTPGRSAEDRHVRLYSPEETATLLRAAGCDVDAQEYLGAMSHRHLWRAHKHEWDPQRLCTSPWDAEATL